MGRKSIKADSMAFTRDAVLLPLDDAVDTRTQYIWSLHMHTLEDTIY